MNRSVSPKIKNIWRLFRWSYARYMAW